MTTAALPTAADGGLSSALSRSRVVDRPLTTAFDHRVTFYEADDSLYRVVVDFFRAGLEREEPLIVIATELHAHGLSEQLRAHGYDVTALCAAGQLTFLDARETLASFMVGGMPDAAIFRATVGATAERLRAASRHNRIRAYGEMVNLLWCDGNPAATVCLEDLWNEFAGTEGWLSLLCGYFMGNFNTGVRESFDHICGSHSRVVPTEEDLVTTREREPTPRPKELDLLQGEIEHRKRLEEALQEALAQRRRAEDALRASQEALRRQNEDLSRTVRFSEMFVGILGHDLRNPLSAITTAASLLRKRADSDKVSKPAARILNSAGRMGRMIDQVLDFTRIRLGKGIPIDPRRCDLLEICRSAIDELDNTGHGRNINLGWSGDCVGQWDGDRLLQLVSNLVGNALTHGQKAHPVTLGLDGSDKETIAVEIHNAGQIPPEVMPMIFEPFGSGSYGRGERPSGLGLGLFIGQQIVLAHLGSIEVTSSETEGTRFVVRLPRNPTTPSPAFAAIGGQS